MSIVTFNGVTKRYDQSLILRDVYFRLGDRERVGLVGKNGTGKTTALDLILGREQPTEGSVDLTRDVRIGYFSQFSELNDDISIREILGSLFCDIQRTAADLQTVQQSLANTPSPDEERRLLGELQRLTDEMEHNDGWTYENKIDTVLSRLGFPDEYQSRPVGQLSGGWRNRAALAKILIEEPDLLLLDEPTNFLDVEGLRWLEQWLTKFTGSALVVSHDRDFLEGVAQRVVEIQNYRFHEYDGGFTQYVREKRLRAKSLNREFQYEEELLALEAESIDDRREMRSNPGKALKRRLANIKKQVEPPEVDRVVTDVYRSLRTPNDLLEVSGLWKAYGDQSLFEELTFELHKGERIAVLGPNGCGKSTLLNILTDSTAPDAGTVKWPPGSAYAYYNRILAELDPDDTITHSVNVVGIAFAAPRKKVNTFLRLLRFSELDLDQRIGFLSGGERARVALAQCLLSGAPVIILDEPTNHLDITSAQVMERALAGFPGAVIVVSHDRFFIDKVATRLLLFGPNGATQLVEGNWTIYQASQEK